MNVALNVAGWRIVAVRAYLGAPFVILEQSSFTALSIQKRWQSGWQSWAGQATIALALPSSQVEKPFLHATTREEDISYFWIRAGCFFWAVLCSVYPQVLNISRYLTTSPGLVVVLEGKGIEYHCPAIKNISPSPSFIFCPVYIEVFSQAVMTTLKKKTPKSPTLNKSSTSYRGWKALTGLDDGVTFVLHARNSALPPYLHHSCSMHTP